VNHHILKLKEEFWDAVFNGEKTFEVRLNDRGFQKGDTVSFCVLRNHGYVGDPEGMFEITYVLNGWGIKEDWVVFSISKKDEK
jgi:hypothetical protein